MAKWTLYELRRERMLTMRELAKELGVSVNSVANWENGLKHPTMATLRKICDYFGVKPSEIELPEPRPRGRPRKKTEGTESERRAA